MLQAGSGHAPNSSLDENKKNKADVSFMHAFIAALSMIIVTELGDKTFFIAAIMAMNHPRVTVFAGAMFALTAMHVMSGKYEVFSVSSSVSCLCLLTCSYTVFPRFRGYKLISSCH